MSGPELAVEVARRVMGWDRAGIVNGRCYIPCGQGYWEPHESIAHAWEVVEKMLPRSLHLWAPGALINDEFGTYSKAWTAQFVAWSETPGAVNVPNWYGQPAEADTAPLAICLAALQAVGASPLPVRTPE